MSDFHAASRCCMPPIGPTAALGIMLIHWARSHNLCCDLCSGCLQVFLEVDNDVKAARIVKGRLERTTLGQVAASMAINLRPGEQSHRKNISGPRLADITSFWRPFGLVGVLVWSGAVSIGFISSYGHRCLRTAGKGCAEFYSFVHAQLSVYGPLVCCCPRGVCETVVVSLQQQP